MPLRLFQILDTATGEPIPDLFFDSKPKAKTKRTELNEQTGKGLRFVVTPGPDHRKKQKA
jgi:hypothetical protein